jgi:diaminopimelate decarboxylase
MAAYRKAIATGVLDVMGLHAHLGGMIHTRETAHGAVNSVLDFVEQLESELGITLEVLNFGGSLATRTVEHLDPLAQRLNRTFHRPLPEPDPGHSLSIEDYVTTLCDTVQQRYRQRGKPLPRIFLEPGRSMTGNTQMLLSSVISSKRVDDAHFLIMDAGINVAESMRSEYHHMFPIRGWSEPKTETYTVVGPICSPADTLCYAWRSRPLAAGEGVAIMDAGAYFVPFSTSFSFPQPGIVMLDQGQVITLRRAERFDDIIRRDVAGVA